MSKSWLFSPSGRRAAVLVGLTTAAGGSLLFPALHALASVEQTACVTLPERAEDVVMALAASNPFSSIEPSRPGDERLRGRVAETVRAGSYTYLHVLCEDGAMRWVVTMSRGVQQGQHVVVKNMGTKRDFRSKRLGRSFDELVFGIVRVEPTDREGDR